MSGIAMGQEQVRHVALVTRMFATNVAPWECEEHDPVDLQGLGREWKACTRCGFLLDPDDRELLLRLVRSES